MIGPGTDQPDAHNTIYAVLVNYNGWADTLECLESLVRCRYAKLRIIVCDNGSSDGSVERLKAWAEGRLDVWLKADHPLRSLSFPPYPKPLSYRVLRAEEVDAARIALDRGERLVVVRSEKNLGFAGGNNLGLKYAQACDDFRYLWILNNDTVVQSDTLSSLVRRMDAHPQAGICGSTILDYRFPDRVQLLAGGSYHRWLGITRLIGKGLSADAPIEPELVASRLSFVSGASMLVSKAFLDSVGPMSERYFLFFEEIDWVIRSQGRFGLLYAPESRLFHKLGATIGPYEGEVGDPRIAQYYMLRNALLIARTYHRHTLPSVHLCLALRALAWTCSGRWSWVKTAVRAVKDSRRASFSS